jgi:murein L,D-transpeptidase YcbB/YkuD
MVAIIAVSCVLSASWASAQPPPPVIRAPPTAPAARAPAIASSAALLQTLSLRPDHISLLRRALADAGSHGLRPEEFRTDAADQMMASGDPVVRRNGELKLMAQAVLYARSVHAGRLPADQFMQPWGLKPPAYDAVGDFVQAVTNDRVGPWLENLPPNYSGYQSLRQGLAVYRQIAANGGWAPLPGGADLALGATDGRVNLLRARLAAEDSAVVANGGPVFDDPLAQALMRAQKRFGLEPNGVLNKSTVAALNVSVDERIGQIQANMERWRWMPPELPTDRIQVNIAAAVLTLFKGDNPVLSMRAVTGRPGDETPMLQSKIHSVVLNPPWNVPSAIATKELWPKERAHPGYLAANDFVVIRDGGGVRLQQRAGPKAALGRVKFDFNNSYGVYLHDTPTHSTFSRYGRLASHGCVRLEKPELLAKTIFAGDPAWTPDAIDSTIASGETVRAQLSQPLAVFLFYWTAYVAPDGAVNFRQDPYGWDRELVKRLTALPYGVA